MKTGVKIEKDPFKRMLEGVFKFGLRGIQEALTLTLNGAVA